MQNQAQSSSSSSSERTNRLLQNYANTNLGSLPEIIIQELEEENFLGVDISGAMNLTDIGVLPPNYLKETLVQSIQLEIEPFSDDRIQKFLEVLNRIHHEMAPDEFMQQIIIIANKNFIDFLPEYFKRQYESLVEKCQQEINTPVCLESTNMNLLENYNHNEIVNNIIIGDAVNLNNGCLSYKMRWQIINNIQNIIFRSENVLKIPVGYSFGLPVYLSLLSNIPKENFAIEIVDVNGISVGNTVNTTIEIDLVRFGLREPEVRYATNRMPVHPIIDHGLSDVENEDPGTEGSRDSVQVQPGTDHGLSDEEEGDDNRHQASFRTLVEHQAAFDKSNLDRRLFGTNFLSSPDAESLIIPPAVYGPKK